MAGEGVEFLLELTAKLDGATKMVRELSRVEAALGHGDKAFKKLEEHGGGALHKLGEWFRELAGEATHTFTSIFAAQAVWDTMKEGVHEIKAMAVEMLEVAGHAERTRMAFENMLGVEPGREMLEYLERVSKSTEFGGQSVKEYGQQLLQAGFDAGNLDRALASVADVAARSPNKMEGASGAVMALSRAMLSGTIDARSLRRIKLAPGAFYKQMAGDLGISTKEVQKQLAAGRISKENLINSIFKALAIKGGGTLGDAGAKMSEGFEARWLKFKEIGELIFQSLGDSPGLVKLGEVMHGITEMFDPKSPTGKAMVEGISKTLGLVADELKKVDFKEMSKAFVDLFSLLPPLINAAAASLRAIGWVGKFIGETAAKLYLNAPDIALKLVGGQAPALVEDAAKVLAGAAGSALFPGKVDPLEAARGNQGAWTGEGLGWDMLSGKQTTAPGGPLIAPAAAERPGPWRDKPPNTITVTMPTTITVPGATASAAEIGQHVAAAVPPAIVAALEQLGLQTGSA